MSNETARPTGEADCFFCKLPVSLDDPDLAKEVKGWVVGPRKDSMKLRQDTGEYAHRECVTSVTAGMPPEQPDLFDAIDSPPGEVPPEDGATDLTSLFWRDR